MYAYDIIGKEFTSPTLKAAIRMEVPINSQGVAFRDDGLMIVSTSYGRLNNSVLRFYWPNWEEVNNETVALVHKNDAAETLTVPPQSQGLVII